MTRIKSLGLGVLLSVLAASGAYATNPKPPETTPVPVFNNSNAQQQGQAQGQLQGQAQGQRQSNSSYNLNNNENIAQGGQGGRGGEGGKAVSRSRSRSSSASNNQGVNNSTSVNAGTVNRDRLQAPSIGVSFSSGKCVPYGVGLSGPGAGLVLQFPDQNGVCPDTEVAAMLWNMGCYGAAVAVLADVPRAQAIRENQCSGPQWQQVTTVLRRKG